MEEHALISDVAAMDIDAKDNIYVTTAFRQRYDQPLSFKLLIFDEDGNKMFETRLSFDQCCDFAHMFIAVHHTAMNTKGVNPVHWKRLC